MKKLAVLTLIGIFAFTNISIGQRAEQRAYKEQRHENHRNMSDGNNKCHKAKKYHKKKMRKMAAADGKITKRERRMLRKDRRRTY